MSSDSKEKIVRDMESLELAYTKLCKQYQDLGEELKNFSVIISSQVDTIELGLWVMETIDLWSNGANVELYDYIAEKLKEKFIVIDKPDVTYPEECPCDQHNGST